MDGQLSNTPHPTPPRTEADRVDWLRLIRSRRVGPSTWHRLVGEHGTARAALDALPGIALAAGAADYEPCPPAVAADELRRGRKAGARPLFLGAGDYPAALAALPDAPPVLWALGKTALLRRPLVAIVGARNASSLGVRTARQLAAALGREGFVVVSGLARGIDRESHAATLETGTIAVHAGGVDVIYPEENTELAERIGFAGLRLSEQPMGLRPQARHFPQRNHIIAGLVRAVIVIEGAARSGSLITARAAADLGREVLAVPGHPFDARAAGANTLIRDGAILIRGAEDVIEALGRPAIRDVIHPAPRPGGAPETVPQPEREPRREAALEGCGKAGPEGRQESPRRTAPMPAPVAGTNHEPDCRTASDAASPFAPGSALERAPAALRSARLHARILDRLSVSPLAEDQLIRDLSVPLAQLAPELLYLELEGLVQRQPGGMLARI